MLAEHIPNSGRQARVSKFFIVHALNHVFRKSNTCSKADFTPSSLHKKDCYLSSQLAINVECHLY